MLKLKADFICLQELKCAGSSLLYNLRRMGIHQFDWHLSSHHDGRGGAAVGITNKLNNLVSTVKVDANYVSVMLKEPFCFSLVCVYAPYNSLGRAHLWIYLAKLEVPMVLVGDFNMVETLSDRWHKLGQTLQGNELHHWNSLVSSKKLIDLSVSSGFSWNNNKRGNNFRAARLDRLYCSNEVTLDYPIFDCLLDKSCVFSDHVPLCFKAAPTPQNYKMGWFHADYLCLSSRKLGKMSARFFTIALASILPLLSMVPRCAQHSEYDQKIHAEG